MPLERSLNLFEQGVRLSRECQERLNEAERRIELLLRDSEGRPALAAFQTDELNDQEDSDAETRRKMKAFSETIGEERAHPATEAHVFLREHRPLIEQRLDRLVPAETIEPTLVHAAMRWSLFAPGKRFRPALVLAVGSIFGAKVDMLLGTACAFEMIHTYSLIHDDLPSMDDDELRRGRPTCHIRFGEAVAILAGDALQTLAFQIIAEDDQLSEGVRVRVIAETARAAGTPVGMVAGQSFDLAAESRVINGEELEIIHRHKTGAMITAAARCGAIIGGANAAQLTHVTQYAAQLGLLFQITDDLLDVTASVEDLGKTPGKDARAQKATYPALYGVEATRGRAESVYREACVALDHTDQPTHLLRAIARAVLERQTQKARGRTAARNCVRRLCRPLQPSS